MPDYSAVFLPGLTMTSTAAGTITGGDTLEVAGSGTVQKTTYSDVPNTVGSVKCVGVAAHDAVTGPSAGAMTVGASSSGGLVGGSRASVMERQPRASRQPSSDRLWHSGAVRARI